MKIAAIIHSAERVSSGVKCWLSITSGRNTAAVSNVVITNFPKGAKLGGLIGTRIVIDNTQIYVAGKPWAERRTGGMFVLV